MRKEIRNGESTKHPEPVSPFESLCYPRACQLERDFLADSMTHYLLQLPPAVSPRCSYARRICLGRHGGSLPW